MITYADAQRRAKESLNGFPQEVVSSYLAFAEKGDPDDSDIVVLGVLRFYLVKKPGEPLASLPGDTKLVADLGCDSLTMMDTVFMVESLFDVKLDDGELPAIQTLDDLRNYVRSLNGREAARAS
ncbi:MAG TPA: acyl carrier protein [Opitutaceae bacterium]|nr:acyl carrier protein [Opitutaceae bacterium]